MENFASRKNNGVTWQNTSTDAFCPYIKKPVPECYCVEMNGNKLNLAMRFCLNDFKNCRIHHRIYLREARAPRS
jgi:hypothetical protein